MDWNTFNKFYTSGGETGQYISTLLRKDFEIRELIEHDCGPMFALFTHDVVSMQYPDGVEFNYTPKKLALVPARKPRAINLYSPEYLAKKHGINLNRINDEPKNNKKASFGFYGSLIILIVIPIALSRSLYFFQDFIIDKLPFTKYYLEYFFENIRNLFEIWKNLISSY